MGVINGVGVLGVVLGREMGLLSTKNILCY